MSRSVTECSKPFEVICDNDLLDSCEELWDIFNCNEGYDYGHPAIKRYRIRIVRKVDPTQNGYLCRFEELPWKPQTDAAEQFKVMNKSESEQTPKSVGQEELNMIGPLRVQSSSAASKDEIIALTPMVKEVANENDFVSNVASDTDSTSSETSRSSASEQSSSDSVHATEEPTDAAAFLDLDYLTVLNTIQELDRKTTIPDQDIYSHGNETKYTRILSTIDDNGDDELDDQVGDTSISIQDTFSHGDNTEYLSLKLINTINDESYLPVKSSSKGNHCGSTTISTDLPQDISDKGLEEFLTRKCKDPSTQHTLHHCIHGEEECPYYDDLAQCKQNLNKDEMKHIRDSLYGSKDGEYDYDIVFHLWRNKCGPGCPLWKVYIQNELYITHKFALKFADEGLVIYSDTDKDKIGTVSKEYIDFDKNEKEKIGSGGFGEVYRCGSIAVKEEHKKPLIIADGKIFGMVTQLKHINVILMKEYIVGKRVNDERLFLFTMPYINKRELRKQFKTHKCVIDYMVHCHKEKVTIFNNFLKLFLHVFKGLEYLHTKGIVHGDVKDTNILVQQNCSCQSPLHCKCSSDDAVIYILTDMDLLCLDGESLPSNYVEWSEMKLHEPAGTYGQKASELYFTGEKGEPCGSNKSDVWAGCVTMMKALVGKEKSEEAHKQIKLFFTEVTVSGDKYASKIKDAYESFKQLKKSVKSLGEMSPAKDKVMSELKGLKDLLKKAKFVAQTRRVSAYTYSEKFPLELILSAVHVANSLQQWCLDKLPGVYTEELWKTMKTSMEFITDGVRFLPQNRPTAAKITGELAALLSRT